MRLKNGKVLFPFRREKSPGEDEILRLLPALLCFVFDLIMMKGKCMTTPSFDSVEAQASYGIGLQVGQQLQESGLQGLQPDALLAGLRDALEGNAPTVPVDVVHRALREVHERAEVVRQERQKALAVEGQKFLEENAQREGVSSTESGLQFSVLTQGEGAIPSRQDRVRVHYTGKLIDGSVFDSSVQRGEPAEFPVSGVIPGWIEALTLMPVGSKWQLVIPHGLAYGERGAGASIPPFSTLVFEVELLDIL
ncbi:FkbP-type peptidyl-prolyl cis-trans isomerase [Erwinia tasmaniensis Et1/99]|uniref:Peptidyl-prolyl cis-trans isomerase n=2 Tax=Erwinia tasmaniensis TaxID=338565 RepID=B2VCY6_ERWT9|nr:FkbP-type peptidyl-prolyl cis-trans isomerase [Erwinia tasmaniensis Et1/99]